MLFLFHQEPTNSKAWTMKLNESLLRMVFFTGENYPFIIKPNFSSLGSIIEIKPNFMRIQIGFVHDDSIRDLVGFGSVVIYEKYYLSQNPVDILSFHIIFIETGIGKGMIFGGRQSGIIHNLTMDVDPGYKYKEKFAGGINWYMMENKDFYSSISFKLKNENNQIVSFNRQSITFRLSIK